MQVQEELLVVSKDHTQMMMIKGKRTKRQRAPSPLRLAMPYNSTSSNSSTNNSIDSATTSSPSPSPTNNTIEFREDEDMANCLILLAQGRYHVAAPTPHHNNNNNNNNEEDDNHKKSTSLYLYQCKTCNRCFPSFQALGGHRASHKKPKQNGTFSSEAVTNFIEENNDRYDPTTSTTLSLKTPNGVSNLCSTITATTTTTKANKVHECSICGAEFSSGQALGGHMRRHRTLVNASMTTSMRGGNVVGSNEFQEAKKPLKLDLNLPALPEDDHHRESKFSFQQREKHVIVFSKSSLVDCHY